MIAAGSAQVMQVPHGVSALCTLICWSPDTIILEGKGYTWLLGALISQEKSRELPALEILYSTGDGFLLSSCGAQTLADFKKNKKHITCKLNFIRGKMRTAAGETASQIALRDRSKEEGGKVRIDVILVKGEYMQSSTYFFRRFLRVMRKRHHHEGF